MRLRSYQNLVKLRVTWRLAVIIRYQRDNVSKCKIIDHQALYRHIRLIKQRRQALSLNLLASHPKGLGVLFFTELWERFSYYGMRAILMLYMTEAVVGGGLGFDVKNASRIYGEYTSWVYLTSIIGGLIADRLLGARKAILVGGIIIALGHFTLAVQSVYAFFGGLILIILGTGLLKPNISTMVGKLYPPGDLRRDAGFSIFYMGINIGAMLAPIVCGFLAQSKTFKDILQSWGMHPEASWHFGFAAAGVGMCIGLTTLMASYKQLEAVGAREVKSAVKTAEIKDVATAGASPQADQITGSADQPKSKLALSADDWSKLGALFVLFFFNMFFWSIFEQSGSSLTLFADRMTDCRIFGWQFPSSWFQSLQPIYVIIFAPVFSWLWLKLAERQPSSPAKFAFGLAFLGLGIAIMVPAAMLAAHGKVSPMFLILLYLLETFGELCLSPVGLSTVTKLAPRAFQSMTMGAWFISTALGNRLAGYFSEWFKEDPSTLVNLFGIMAVACFAAAAILGVCVPLVKKMMKDVK